MSIRPPRISRLPTPHLEPFGAQHVVVGDVIEASLIADTDLAAVDFGDVSLTTCSVVRTSLDDADLTGVRVVDSRFDEVSSARVFAPRSMLHNVRIENSRIGALDLFGGKMRSVIISDCKLGLVNLSGNEARDVIFRSCVIDELDVSEATLTRVAFDDTAVASLDVHRATLTDVDLRDLRVNSVRNLGGLAGATITARQAVGLAEQFSAHLGIAVE